MYKSETTKICRLCGSKKLNKFINFGKVPLGNNLFSEKKKSLKANTYPLKVLNCTDCNHYQLSYQVNPKILYATDYTYLSGIAKSFGKHFKIYSDWILKKCKLKKNSLVLDIGSNDGTCLSYFKKNKMKVLGIDPADLPSKIANNNKIKTIKAFFDLNSAKKINDEYGKIDFITSHNVLAHIGDINQTFKNIFYLLKNNGYFCFEVGYFLNVLEKNYFDTIYHEHLDYHHAHPLVKFLVSIGFSVVHIETNKIQGGTLRILCKKEKKNQISNQVNDFLKKEKKTKIFNKYFLKNWEKLIYQNCYLLNKIIKKELKSKKIIIGYGAPTKATLLIKLSKINYKMINYIIEDNHLKINKYIPKTAIKIIGNEKLKKLNPNSIVLFAWNFYKDIIIKLKKDKIKNINIIVPAPRVRKIKL